MRRGLIALAVTLLSASPALAGTCMFTDVDAAKWVYVPASSRRNDRRALGPLRRNRLFREHAQRVASAANLVACREAEAVGQIPTRPALSRRSA